VLCPEEGVELFKLDLHFKEKVVIISLNGNFEKFDTMEVIERVEEQIKCRRCKIIFVLNGVQRIDKHGVEALVSSMAMVKAWGGKIILADIPGPIRDFPQFKDGLRGFEIYDTESEALQHITVQSETR
jgi:anti-anti-sigma factor